MAKDNKQMCFNVAQNAYELLKVVKLQYAHIKEMNEYKKVQSVKTGGETDIKGCYSFELSTQIPALPAAFCGGLALVQQAKSIIFGVKGANLAITGTGGMGKTILGVALLHDKDIRAHFGVHLHFVPSETFKSVAQLINGLLLAFNHPDANALQWEGKDLEDYSVTPLLHLGKCWLSLTTLKHHGMNQQNRHMFMMS
ncbi:hypothetical protein AX17_006974 [Amanita inopinata Kibby_2008]|nr:hypothetical protein AX17_006974 [Amanita inopinata Kibby_2008]